MDRVRMRRRPLPMTEPAMMAVRLLEALLVTFELMVVGIRLAVWGYVRGCRAGGGGTYCEG
jgi:hypothetical protein